MSGPRARSPTGHPAEVRRAPLRGTARVVTMTEEAGRPEITVTEVAGREAAEQVLADAQADPEVLSVEIDGEVSALQSSPWNDPWRDLQWGLDRLSAEEANY